MTGATSPSPSDIPSRIGPFKILAQLGEGSFGVVYKAERRDPVRQTVALKVLRAGVATKEVLARFELERRALAAMNHRCIAKVLDAGATERGEPWVAMELVEGLPLTTYCDTHKLSLRDRLVLFQQVCDGVQHAHQKGVVHRDLKPGNVFVVREGDNHVPKILDFGLAKATHRDVFGGGSFATQKDMALGTLEYMSPEQARANTEAIDVRSDVYSLGVMLYELLCGELPFPSAMLKQAGEMEARRVVVEDEPKKPSTKLLSRHDSEILAAQRRSSLGALKSALSGDLDWLVMKALRKEPEQRYGAALAMAADIGRYLAHEPLEAGPPSWGYRAKKFIRKYRVQCVAGVAVVCAIVAGGIGTAMGYADAREQERIAQEATKYARESSKQAESLAVMTRVVEDADRLSTFRAQANLFTETAQDISSMEAWVGEVESSLRAMPDHSRRLRELREQEGSFKERWSFARPMTKFFHDALERLVDDIAEFCSDRGAKQVVSDKLAWARQARQKTVDAHQDRWQKAIAELADHPKFSGKPIAPQEGLVPLGVDPDTGDQKLQAFAFLRSAGVFYDLSKPWEVDANSPIVFVLLPGAQTMIGNPAKDAMKAEGPQQQVTLAPFFLAKHELTQAQWRRLWEKPNPSVRSDATTKNSYAENMLFHPAENMSWLEATELAARHGLALPTEAQWEYGCRAGTMTQWHFGDTLEDVAPDNKGRFNAADGFKSREALQLYFEDSEFFPELDDGWPFHAPVHAFEPNAFGLYNMHGNVAELTRDAYAPYDGIARMNLTRAIGDAELLGAPAGNVVHRGGSWFKRMEAARSFVRKRLSVDMRSDQVGVRFARAMK